MSTDKDTFKVFKGEMALLFGSLRMARVETAILHLGACRVLTQNEEVRNALDSLFCALLTRSYFSRNDMDAAIERVKEAIKNDYEFRQHVLSSKIKS